MSFAVGLYFGIGIGWSTFTLCEVGFGAGYRLLWRVAIMVMFWPAFLALPFIGMRR